MSLDYKKAGVDIDAGDALVEWIKTSQPKNQPHQDRLVSGIGGFASLFRMPKDKYDDPCLVTCTDGVGTKLKLAVHFNEYKQVGQDLVAMSVNDLICCGAEPLLFLDYFATGKLQLDQAKDFVSGVRDACIRSQCLLIGGETAEMPGVYHDGDFDCAGFAVGVVDRKKALGPENVRSGDQLIAVRSSGFHSNGFSLLRKVFAQDLTDWKEQLLEPTALYAELVLQLQEKARVSALAHITGGGIENVLRIMPAGMDVCIKSWDWPQPFKEVQKRTEMSDFEMLRTLNCGVGLVIACPKDQADLVLKLIDGTGYSGFHLGEVVASQGSQPKIHWQDGDLL